MPWTTATCSTLAARGRVRFHEANEYILWQGEPHKQSRVRDSAGDGVALGRSRRARLRCATCAAPETCWASSASIRRRARHCLHSARSESDVVIYAFPASDFEELVLKYPYARQFVEAHDTVDAPTISGRRTRAIATVDVPERRDRPKGRGLLRRATRAFASWRSRCCHRVRRDRRRGRRAIASRAVRDGRGRSRLGRRGRRQCRPADRRAAARASPPAVGSAASVTDGVLAIAEAGADALAVTSDGSSSGRLHALVTPRDIGRVFGDQPIAILRGHSARRDDRGNCASSITAPARWPFNT